MLYSADEVASALGLHVRTIRGYVRDGRLPAVRIGKQYRIAERDLLAFTGGRPAHEEAEASSSRVEASAIVQIDNLARAGVDRVTTHVVAASNSRSGARRGPHVQTVYDESRGSLKVVVVGDADDTAEMITLITTLVNEADK